MKKFLSLAIVLALAVASLASCGGDDTTTTSSDTKAPGTTASTAADTTAAAGDDTTAAAGDDTTVAGDDTTAAAAVTDAPSTGDQFVDPDMTGVLASFNFQDEFEFDDNWNVGTGTPNISAECVDGVLKIEYEGPDPMIIRDSIDEEVATADIKTIEIRAKNLSADQGGEIFFGTTNTDFSQSASIKFTYANSGEDADWEVVTLNVADYASTLTTFTGDLTKIRLDPNDQGQEGTIYIDYILIKG